MRLPTWVEVLIILSFLLFGAAIAASFYFQGSQKAFECKIFTVGGVVLFYLGDKTHDMFLKLRSKKLKKS